MDRVAESLRYKLELENRHPCTFIVEDVFYGTIRKGLIYPTEL